jgi:hypothetical protein
MGETTKYLVFRWLRDEWQLLHANVDTLDIACDLRRAALVENPTHRFRILKVTETVVYEDAKA